MSAMERLCIASFLKHGHRFILHTYDRPDGLPDGVEVRDASEIIPREQSFRLYGSWSSFSDHFRYALMSRTRGWWSDLDVVCLRPLVFLCEYAFMSEHPSGTSFGTNALFKVPFASEMMMHCDAAASRLPTPRQEHADAPVIWNGNAETRGFCDAGWQIFYDALLRFGLDELVSGGTMHVGQPEDFVSNEGPNPAAECYAVHFSAFNWERRRWPLSRDASYHPNSLYERLKAEYL